MYTNIKTILRDAADHSYGVIATSPLNMETARGIVTAATKKQAPIIFLLGQNMMRQHAKAELLIPMIRTLAEHSSIPIATCLDHGNNKERILYAFRNGFSSIMFDGSLYNFSENIEKTRQISRICHAFEMGIEGELGHVGVAANGDQIDESIYTQPKNARKFIEQTGVDCLAVAVGTAHGEYPKGIRPHINFQRIREIKDSVDGMPIALHGGSGSGDENIVRAVEAGINKINVVTDVFLACRNNLAASLAADPQVSYMQLMMQMELAVEQLVSHWIDLSGSKGTASHFTQTNCLDRLLPTEPIGNQE